MADFTDEMISMKIILYPSNETEEYLFNEECTIAEVHRNITEILQVIGSRSLDPNNFRVWQINPLRELSKRQLTLRQMQVPRECSVLVMPPDVPPPRLSKNDQLDPSFNFNDTRNNAENRSNEAPANNDAPNQNAPGIPDTKITLKIIVFPANRTDEFLFDEEDTIQKVHKHIAELLQFIGTRSPNPQNFKVWQMHPRQELSKPLLTLRQMQVPRECLVVVMPPDMKLPLISNDDQLRQILSAFNSHSSRDNADNIINQVPSNDTPDHGHQKSTEESAPKEKRTRKRKSSTKKVDSTDELFSKSTQFICEVCLRTFGSTRAVRTHLTKIHPNIYKKATGKACAVQRAKVVKRNEQPKKKAKENNNFIFNITLNNISYSTNNHGLGRGDFY